MSICGKDNLQTRRTLNVGDKSYDYYSLKVASEKIGDVSKLPFTLKVVLENLLRYEDEFVNTVHFYPSDRNDNTKLKDLVCVSYLTDEQLVDFSYSDTYVKFKLLDLFKQLGIRGARNGRDVNRPGHYKYYAVKLEPSSRQVVKRIVNEYESDERLIFNNSSLSEIAEEPTVLEGYLKRVCDII